MNCHSLYREIMRLDQGILFYSCSMTTYIIAALSAWVGVSLSHVALSHWSNGG